MLLSTIDASVLEWFCALSGQYHSVTDGNRRNYFHLLRERKIILPLSGAAWENNQAYFFFFFQAYFLDGFLCEVEECWDENHCAHCWPAVSTDVVQDSCSPFCGDILVGGL